MSQQPMGGGMEITSDDKLWAALGYPIAIVAIIVLFMEDKKIRPFIKYHAVQSIALNIVFFVVASIVTAVTFGIGALCFPVAWLVFLYWAYRAYQGELFTVPVVTDFIKNQGWA